MFQPLKALAFAAAACAMAATFVPREAAALDSDEKSEIGAFIREYLIAHPEVLLEAQDALAAKQKAAQREQLKSVIANNRQALFKDPADVTLGNPDGDVNVVEFFDYNCPYCQHALADMNTILADDKKVGFILKEWPILGDDSVAASRVSMALRTVAPEKYRDFHERLLGGEARATRERALAIAGDLGVDSTALKARMDDPAIADSIRRTLSLANSMGMTGTPAYVIGDELISGAYGADVLAEKIANMRKCDSTVC